MRNRRQLITGSSLVLLSIVLAVLGLDPIIHHPNVLGGPMVWILYFSGSLIFLICGILVIQRPNGRAT